MATAAYGSPLEPSVQDLRDFRDDVLLVGASRRVFEPVFRAYYRIGPPVARAMERHPGLRHAVRYALVAPLARAVDLGERLGLFELRSRRRRSP